MGRNKLPQKSQAEKRQQKNRSWKIYQNNRSRAQFVSDYLLLTAPEQHRQATAFYNELRAKYPEKRDIRKTDEFRHWQLHQVRPVQSTSREMVLNIPLIPIPNRTKTKEIQTQQAREDLITLDMIPSDVMNQLMKEIRTDPVLEQILNDFDFQEEVLDEGTVPENVWGELDIGLDIEIDDRLEQEIDSIVQF